MWHSLSWLCRWVVWIAFALLLHTCGAAGPVDERAFSEGSRQWRSEIRSAFESRLAHSHNLSYTNEMRLTIHHNVGNRPGAVKEVLKRDMRAWRLGNAFRLESDLFHPKDLKNVSEWANSGFDFDEGAGRCTIRFRDGRQPGARIDTRPDALVIDDNYQYWLDAGFGHKEEYLFVDLLKHADAWRVETQGDRVRLTCPYQPYWETAPGGDRVLLLDPSKGFLPVSGESIWNGRETMWRIERFEVRASREVTGIWMPLDLHEETISSAASEIVSVRDTTIKQIQHAGVTKADLEVVIPEGAQVVDAISATTWIADAQGNPRAGATEPVYGAGVAAGAPPSPHRRWLIITAGGAIVLGLILAVAIRRVAR